MFLITVSNTVTGFFKMLTFKLFFKRGSVGAWEAANFMPRSVGGLAGCLVRGGLSLVVEGGLSSAAGPRRPGSRARRRSRGWLGEGGGRQVGFSSHSGPVSFALQACVGQTGSVPGAVWGRDGPGASWPELRRQPGPSCGQTLILAFPVLLFEDPLQGALQAEVRRGRRPVHRRGQ